MTVYFSMGIGLNGRVPGCAEVLDCLSSDSQDLDGKTFEDWADDYGYDPESRKAERIFKACQKTAVRLRVFLGSEAFEELLNQVEKL